MVEPIRKRMIDRWIAADTVQRTALEEKFNCSRETVNKALLFRRDGPKSRAIRTYAVNFLGCLIKDNLDRYL